MTIPNLLLKRLYTVGSLKNTDAGAQFALKNRLGDAEVTALGGIAIDGKSVALDHVQLAFADERVLTPAQVTDAHPLPFPLRSIMTIRTGTAELKEGTHEIEIAFEARPFGSLHLKVEDAISNGSRQPGHIPRDETIPDFPLDCGGPCVVQPTLTTPTTAPPSTLVTGEDCGDNCPDAPSSTTTTRPRTGRIDSSSGIRGVRLSSTPTAMVPWDVGLESMPCCNAFNFSVLMILFLRAAKSRVIRYAVRRVPRRFPRQREK